MKTVFIITTREYPINNSDFNSTDRCDYISTEQWGMYIKPLMPGLSATWKGSNRPVPILRYRHKDDTLFYVAPSLIEISKYDYRCE